MKTFRVLPAFNGSLAANTTATVNIPIGFTIHSFMLDWTGSTTFGTGYIDDIRIKVDGRLIWECDGTNLDKINKYLGRAASANNRIMVDMDRFGLYERVQREITALGTGAPLDLDPKSKTYNPKQIKNVQMEVDIGTGAAGVSLTGKYEVSGSSPTGVILKRRKQTRSVSGAGTLDISDLPTGDLINTIFLHDGGNTTDIVLERDSFQVADLELLDWSTLVNDGIRTAQSNQMTLDPCYKGFGDQPLTTNVNDFRIKVTSSGADTLTLFIDYIGRHDTGN